MATEPEQRVIDAALELFDGVTYTPGSEKCQVRTVKLDELREALIALKEGQEGER